MSAGPFVSIFARRKTFFFLEIRKRYCVSEDVCQFSWVHSCPPFLFYFFYVFLLTKLSTSTHHHVSLYPTLFLSFCLFFFSISPCKPSSPHLSLHYSHISFIFWAAGLCRLRHVVLSLSGFTHSWCYHQALVSLDDSHLDRSVSHFADTDERCPVCRVWCPQMKDLRQAWPYLNRHSIMWSCCPVQYIFGFTLQSPHKCFWNQSKWDWMLNI